jgi:hypothetical protein
MILFVEKEKIYEVGMAYALMKKARDNSKKAKDTADKDPNAPAAKGSQPKKVKYVAQKPKELSASQILAIFKRHPIIYCVKVISPSKKEYLLGSDSTGSKKTVKYKVEGNTIFIKGRIPFLKSDDIEFNLDNLQFARDSAVLNNKIYADMKDGTSIFIDYF